MRIRNVFFVLFLMVSVSFLQFPEESVKDITGIWKGKLNAGGVELTLVVKISRDDNGKLKAAMDSPDQGALDIPVDEITLDGDQLIFKINVINGVYNGHRVSGDGIDGEWSQSGMKFPLNLERSLTPPEYMKRPQEPERPLPYIEEEVKYVNQRDGTVLAGTLTLPSCGSPFGAVVLITGSGAQDRNETVAGHRPFLVLSDHLTRNGIAVLRTDDRGVGGSSGSTGDSTSVDFAYDALAGVEFLKSRPEIRSGKIGLLGHSEGGIVGPIAASLSDDVSFVVMMAGTGMTGEEIIYLQSRLISIANGMSPEEAEEGVKQQKMAFEIVKKYPDNETARLKLKELFNKIIESLPEEKKGEEMPDEKQLAEQADQILSPWFRFFLTYNPVEALKKVKCPVLAINGEKDLQVPPKENIAVIEKVLKESGNRNVTVMILPGLNHLFQTAETGSPAEYTKIQETIAPAALKLITEWVKEQIRSK